MVRSQESILCLSHLRWNFVYQRPQHLLTRCAREHRVVFFEEPMFDSVEPELELRSEAGVSVAVPHLAPETPTDVAVDAQRRMIDRLLFVMDNPRPVLWYYTPMPLVFTHHVKPRAVVYDCMEELSALHGAPPALTHREQLLVKHADVVFTAGHSLYQHKRKTTHHKNIHPFPSSVDVSHFAQAREPVVDPADQAAIPHPRVGFFGTLDELLDITLLDRLAEARPDLQFVMIGPVVRIDPARLPRRSNIHWLGGKTYAELPTYLAGWDVAMMPFARSEATRFMCPTKPLEYLAAGKPVVATSISDVVSYGRNGLAWLADSAVEFSAAIDQALASDRTARVTQADSFLAGFSWDDTWEQMWRHVERSIVNRASLRTSGLVPARIRA